MWDGELQQEDGLPTAGHALTPCEPVSAACVMHLMSCLKKFPTHYNNIGTKTRLKPSISFCSFIQCSIFSSVGCFLCGCRPPGTQAGSRQAWCRPVSETFSSISIFISEYFPGMALLHPVLKWLSHNSLISFKQFLIYAHDSEVKTALLK